MARTLTWAAQMERAPLRDNGQTFHRDPTLPGFGCVIGRTARTWTYQLDVRTLAGWKTVRKAVGRLQDKSYKDARREAELAMAELRTGRRKPNGQSVGPTLQEAHDHYIAVLKKKGRAPGTAAQITDCITRTLRPWLQTPLRQLAEDPAAVAERYDEITEESGPYQASHTMRSLRAVYLAARKLHRDLPPDHPCVGVEWNHLPGRKDAMGEKQLREWFQELAALENPVRREMHLLCLLTGLRRRNLTGARWEHIDVKRRAWHVPRAKSGRSFDVPLSRAILASLARLRRACRLIDCTTPWLFPSTTSVSGHVEEIKGDLHKHGHSLRRTYITQSKSAGVSTFLAKCLVDHSAGSGVHESYVSVPALHAALLDAQTRISRHLLGGAPEEVRQTLRTRQW
jgi:integrase